MSKKSILIVTPLVPPESGGPSYLSVSLKEALEKKGEKVDLIAFKEVRNYPSGIRHFLFLYKVLWRARKVDALIILDTVSVALPAVLAGWLLQKKMIVRAGGDFVWERYIERTKEKVLLSVFYKERRELNSKERLLIWVQKRIIFPLATTIVFNTSWFRDIWIEAYHINKNKTAIIEHAHQKKEEIHVGGKGFLCVWRPTAFKNIPALEKAYILAKKKNPDITLEIYKNISREKLFDHMKYARALIIPSLTETSSVLAREALEIGLPGLLTDDCGSKTLLDTHVTWVNPLDPYDIAEKMCALMDEKRYEQEKEKVKNFTYSHTYEQIANEFLNELN